MSRPAGPAYDAADLHLLLFVSVSVMLALVLAYLLIRWVLGGSDAYETPAEHPCRDLDPRGRGVRGGVR